MLLDWVPAHFPSDAHGLAQLRRHARCTSTPTRAKASTSDWNTLIYNFGRNEVRNFLVGSALYWLERYGVDGLRVDAVASMLYRDYSRQAGEWVPNVHGGRENLEAIALLRASTRSSAPSARARSRVAEESHRLPRRQRADLRRRPGLPLQVEHGLDARHAGATCARTRSTGAGTTTR